MDCINRSFILCLVLSFFLAQGVCFSENNPYGFEMVTEADTHTALAETGQNEKVDMEEVNENDTYQAQTNADATTQANADAAAMRNFEREAAALSKITSEEKPQPPKESAVYKKFKTRQPAKKILEIFDKIQSNPKAAKFFKTVRYGWEKFKKWFVSLPGIRHWLASPYSMENYRKELGNVDYAEKKEKRNQLKKNSSSAKMLKEGKKQFFK